MTPVTILISSFDGYSDCWAPVCHGFSKYWPDCPYPIYLMTNTKEFPHDRVQVMKVGGDRDWSGRMLTALERIQTPYVMYFQEDYWIKKPVDTAKIVSYANLMEQHGLNYLRLLSKPEPDIDFPHDSRLGILKPNAAYRTSVQITFWRREVFLELLRLGESVWQFESQGTVRSQKYGDTFLSTKQHAGDDYYHGIYYVCTAVNLGKWARIAKDYARDEGLDIDFGNLPSETWWDDYKRSSPLGMFLGIWAYRSRLLLRSPARFWRKVSAWWKRKPTSGA